MSILGKAIALAAAAHQDQEDKNGQPYILHPIRVMMKRDSDLEITAAILQDVAEDTNWTFDQLKAEGFSDVIIDLVSIVS